MGFRSVISERLKLGALRRLRRDGQPTVQRANRAARVMVDRIDSEQGVGPEWSQTRYGEYYATSTAVHAAVRVRADAVARPPLIVQRRASPLPQQNLPFPEGEGVGDSAGRTRTTATYIQAGPDDPMQRLLDRPNPSWSAGDLWRATETYLLLWGSAYWGIERDRSGRVRELWPLRPDRMRVLPDAGRYVKGFVYEHGGDRVAYLPEEIVWFRHFNPLEEFSGLSSVAPARLAVDMGAEALKFNRHFFSNSAMPADLAITTQETPTDEEVADFYERWESRFRGSGRAHRPVLLSRGMDAKRLGLSQKDMEFLAGLRWTVDEVARAFGVPKVFLAQLEDATLSNVQAQERFLWRNTVVPELRLLEDAVTRSLAPLFEEFPGQYRVQFDLTAVEALQESENDRVDRLVKLVGAGVISAAEARARDQGT